MWHVVRTLAEAEAEAAGGAALATALAVLRDPELLRVTRDEYFTYLTPDTELYDKTAVPGSLFLSLFLALFLLHGSETEKLPNDLFYHIFISKYI
jgi:hypothetical protein